MCSSLLRAIFLLLDLSVDVGCNPPHEKWVQFQTIDEQEALQQDHSFILKELTNDEALICSNLDYSFTKLFRQNKEKAKDD